MEFRGLCLVGFDCDAYPTGPSTTQLAAMAKQITGTLPTWKGYVKKRLAAETTNGLTGAKTPPAPTGALPADTYTNFSKIRLPGRVADLKHIEKRRKQIFSRAHRAQSVAADTLLWIDDLVQFIRCGFLLLFDFQ